MRKTVLFIVYEKYIELRKVANHLVNKMNKKCINLLWHTTRGSLQ